jgi:hypothetical protein
MDTASPEEIEQFAQQQLQNESPEMRAYYDQLDDDGKRQLIADRWNEVMLGQPPGGA